MSIWMVTAAVLLASAPDARAQDPLTDGTELMQQGRYDDALRILLPAYAAEASSKLAYAIARCYEGTGEDGLALDFYESALRLRPRLDRDARDHARRRIKALKGRPGRTSKATLYLDADAVGGLVLLDGTEIGRAPLSGVLIPPGRHTISVVHSLFERWDHTFTAAPRESVRLRAAMTDKPTDVLVHSEPAGATARLQGGQECVTPCLMPLRAGSYEVSFQREGHQTLVHTFSKAPGQMVEVRVQLVEAGAEPQQPAAPGTLSLSVDRRGAQVAVDGTAVGRSPVPPLPLTPGLHNITVRLDGYLTWSARVRIGSGQTTEVPVSLRPLNAPSPNTTESISTVEPPQDDHTALGWGLLGPGIGLTVGGILAVVLPQTAVQKRKVDLAQRFRIEGVEYISGITRVDALELEAQAQTWSYVGYAGIGVGVGLLVAGAVILGLNDPPGEDGVDPYRPGVGLAPMVTPDTVGASATLQF